MKVMLVDDSKTMRNIQKQVLAQLQITDIIEAVNGQDALSRVGAENPDLILLDWNMPTMDGMTFLKAFRQSDMATPVIMVTTEAERRRVIEAIKAGVNNYVVKPFTAAVLKEKIEKIFERIE
mgnify:CR=1 FL=1